MEITNKTERIIWAGGTILLLFLSAYMMANGKDYNCNKCEVTLYNQRPLQEGFMEFGTYNVRELFEEYINGTCIIKWDPNQGYYVAS